MSVGSPSETPALSVVVPAYDEAPNLEALVAEVRAALDPTGLAWELVIVDDGSGDETPALLARLASTDPRVRSLRLAARSGQTAALLAGFRATRAPLIATLDADLQCPPSELPALLAALGDADLACGVRTGRDDPLTRRLASAISNLGRRCLVAPRVRDLACPLRVFRAGSLARVEALAPLRDGAHRWLPALFVLAGLRVVQRPVPHVARRAGESKYTNVGRAGPVARESMHVFGLALRRSPLRRTVVGLTALALVSLPFFHALGVWPLLEPDEGRNAEVAREMLELGSWSVPHFNGLPYLDKPALLFWTIAAAFRAVGVTELGARLPSALAATASVLLTFLIGRALVGTRRGVVAALAFATAPLVLVFARLAIFDMPLTALVTAALYCLIQGRRTGDAWRWWPAAGVAMGLAILCKGPVGVAIPLLAWAAGRGALPPPPRRPSGAAAVVAVALCIAIVVPWLALVHGHEPTFLRYALLEETFERMTSAARFRRGGAPYYYALVLAWAGGGWTILLLACAPALVRRWRAGGPDAGVIAFTVRAALALVLFFSCVASKRPQYILPALVPLSVLAAIGITAAPRAAASALRALAVALVVAGIGGAIAGHLGFAPEHGDLRVVTPRVVFDTGLLLVAWGLLALGVGRRPLAAIACTAVLGPALGMMLLHPLTGYAESRSSRALAQKVPPDTRLVAAVSFRTSLPFYLGRPVTLVSSNGHELTSNYVIAMRARFMGGRWLKSPEGFADTIDGETPTLILVTRWRKQDIRRLTRRRLELVDADRRSMLLRPAG